jgi:hypothetical protein
MRYLTILLVCCWMVDYMIQVIVAILMCWMNDSNGIFGNVVGVFDM